MEHINYIEYKRNTLIEPAWLSDILTSLCIYVVMFTLPTFVFGLLEIKHHGEITDSFYSFDIPFLAVSFLLLSLLQFFTYRKSNTKIYDNGIVEINRFALRKKRRIGINKGQLSIKTNEIKEIEAIMLVDTYIFKKMYLKITLVNNSWYCIDVKEQNEFIKELLKHNPNIKTPELPII